MGGHEVQRRLQGGLGVGSVDGRADRGGDEPGGLEALAGVMGDQAGVVNGPGQSVVRGTQGEGDAHRGYSHGGAVGGALPTGAARVSTGAHPLQGELGGGTQQVQGAAGAHVVLPGQEGIGEPVGADVTAAVDDEAGQDEGLLGVIRDAACRHRGGDGLLGHSAAQAGDGAVVLADLLRAHGLGGHAQRVAEGQTGQRPQGALAHRGGIRRAAGCGIARGVVGAGGCGCHGGFLMTTVLVRVPAPVVALVGSLPPTLEDWRES